MLQQKTHELAEGANFAVLTTVMPDGHPQSHAMWVDSDGERLLVNTEIHRQKFENIERDPRVTVTVMDGENPYSYVEVRGKVVEVVRGPQARRHIDELSRKYTGHDYGNPIRSERVMLVIEPHREVVH